MGIEIFNGMLAKDGEIGIGGGLKRTMNETLHVKRCEIACAENLQLFVRAIWGTKESEECIFGLHPELRV